MAIFHLKRGVYSVFYREIHRNSDAIHEKHRRFTSILARRHCEFGPWQVDVVEKGALTDRLKHLEDSLVGQLGGAPGEKSPF